MEDPDKSTGEIKLFFQDEAGFGCINKPRYRWCFSGVRPTIPCHHIREYRYAHGAVEPLSGESFSLVLPYCNTDCINAFLKGLSDFYKNDYLLLASDGAAWHKSKTMQIPKNIEIFNHWKKWLIAFVKTFAT